jgi:ribokinase
MSSSPTTPLTRKKGGQEKGVSVVGSTNMDLVYNVPHLPKTGETLFATSYEEGLGGKGNNQAIMVAKLAMTSTSTHPKCIFVSCVGEDEYGRKLLSNFEQHLDNVETIYKLENIPSGRAVINVDTEGRNNIVLLEGANAVMSEEHVDRAWDLVTKHTRVLVVQNEIKWEVTAHALRRGHESGLLTIFNPAPAPHHELDVEVMKCVDIFCPNETEAIALLGDSEFKHKAELTVEDGQKIAKALYDKYVQQSADCKRMQVIVTMGGNGSVAYYDPDYTLERKDQPLNHVIEHIPIREKVKVVDTTGAGDAFVGSLSYFLSCDLDLRDSIPLSVAVASISVQSVGTQKSYPDTFDW